MCIKHKHLYNIEKVPSWMIRNRDLVSGYRKPNSSLGSLLCSLFYPHNDLLNIWTHICGICIFFYLSLTLRDGTFSQVPQIRRNPDQLEVFPIYVFLVNVSIMMLFSVIYHWFRPRSEFVFNLLRTFDIGGICFFNFGGFYSVNYYVSYCQPLAQKIYGNLIMLVSLVVFFLILLETLNKKPVYFSGNSLLFAMVGLNFMIVLHWLYWGLTASPENGNLTLKSYLVYIPIIGAVDVLAVVCFYIGHIPEKYIPRKFDILCNSHTLWHVTSFVALIFHYKLILSYYEDRFFTTCPVKQI